VVYRLSMAVDENICLEIEELSFDDIVDAFEQMGGKKDWLINSARAAVAASLNGEPVRVLVRSLGGEVISDTEAPQTSNSSPASNGQSNGQNAPIAKRWEEPAATTQTALRSDPWAADRNDYPGEASIARQALTRSGRPGDDPWNTAGAPASSNGITITRDKFGGEWATGVPGAPDCNCGQPAARLKTKSKAGKLYSVWRCAKAAGDEWPSKCSFSEFPS
jgi:hypothetical protein